MKLDLFTWSSRTFSQLLIFFKSIEDWRYRWKKKVRLLTQWGSLEFIRFLFPFPLPGFEESTEGWKFAFPLEGWCPRPRAQTVRSQCRPILFFRCNKGNRAKIKLINYFLDIKERLLVKENKKKKGMQLHQPLHSTLLSTWDTILFRFQDFPEKPGISTLPTRDETSPRKYVTTFVPASQRNNCWRETLLPLVEINLLKTNLLLDNEISNYK